MDTQVSIMLETASAARSALVTMEHFLNTGGNAEEIGPSIRDIRNKMIYLEKMLANIDPTLLQSLLEQIDLPPSSNP